MGAAVSLPLLDSMVPALTAQSRTAAKAVQRLGFVYVPHGAVMQHFTPATLGRDFAFSPILQPLSSFRNHVVVVSGLDNPTADFAGVHSLSPPTWLSGVRPAEKEGAIRAGITTDQIAAAKIGQQTQFPSLELATEDHSNLIGACDGGYSCTYINTLSWRTPTTPLPMEVNPRVLFERLFGEGGSAEEQAARLQQDRSLLDAVTQQANRLKMQVGASDKHTLNQYLENVREIERRIQAAEKQGASSFEAGSAPLGIPESYEAHVKLMFDLQALALQADLTRVSTFMMARELSQQTYPQVNVSDPHHSVSHHQNDQAKLDALVRIQTLHAGLFAYYLEKLRSTPDGEGSLLDHSMILYGSNMSNSNLHNHYPLPAVLVGGAAGKLQGNRHLRYEDHTPISSLLQTMLAKMDVPVEKLGDSTGLLTDL
ncbi:MAG: DUF1552 domain-containing protein [Acidobacteriota bacterium]